MPSGWGSLTENPIPGDVLACLEELGVAMVRQVDDEIHVHCPAHLRRVGKEDRSTSCSVNAETGLVNCFSCGFAGPFVVVVKEMLNCNDDIAVAWIKARGSIERAKRILSGEVREREEAEEVTEADLALYIPVPTWAAHDRDCDPDACDAYGILWDEEEEHWIFPIRDPYTNVLWGWQEKGHTDRYFNNHPKNMQKSLALFGADLLPDLDEAILVESPLDAARVLSAGIEGGCSSFGAKWSTTQIEIIIDSGVSTLICALDDDEAGNEKAGELKPTCRGRINLKYWNYGRTGAKDPGDQSDEEIRESYATAYTSVLWVPDADR